MKPPADAIQTVGTGPDLLLIHGTATDKASWNILVQLLRDRFRITTYDRRFTRGWPQATDAAPCSVEEHAADAAEIIAERAAGSAFVCGISFGAVVALELMRRQPDLVRGAALFEPPVVPRDDLAGRPGTFLIEFERLVNEGHGEQGGELFQRRRLSDAKWERLPAAMKDNLRSNWQHIYADLAANAAYRPRYGELVGVDVPVLLLRGGRSGVAFEDSLRALGAALPRSNRRVMPAAAHHLEGQAWRELAAALTELADSAG